MCIHMSTYVYSLHNLVYRISWRTAWFIFSSLVQRWDPEMAISWWRSNHHTLLRGAWWQFPTTDVKPSVLSLWNHQSFLANFQNSRREKPACCSILEPSLTMCQDFSWYRPEASVKILKSPAAGPWRQQRPHAAGRGAGPRAAGQRPRAGGGGSTTGTETKLGRYQQKCWEHGDRMRNSWDFPMKTNVS